MNYKLFSILAFAISMSLFCSCRSEKKNEEHVDRAFSLPDSLRKTLVFDTVSLQSRVEAMTLTGNVDFDQDHVVRVYPMVSGALQDMHILLGDYVHAGQTLGVIKSQEISGMSADLISAKTNVELAKKALDVAKEMHQSGLNTQTDLMTAKTNYEQALISLNKNKQLLNLNGASGNNSVLKAPISGFVVEKFVSNNMFIRPDNAAPLLTISDLKDVWVMANVYESNVGNVKAGDPVEVTTLAYPGKVFYGKVNEIMNVLDPSSKVMKLKIVLPNPGYALKPQMFASVKVMQRENGQALAVSSKALVFDNSQYYVLIYHGPSDIRITPVQIISEVGDRVYVEGGVQQGDVLIGSQALLIYQALND